jgi:hypothetical protein
MTGQKLFLFFSFVFPPDTEIKTCVGRTHCWSVGGLLISADRAARWLHGFSFLFFFGWEIQPSCLFPAEDCVGCRRRSTMP